MNHSAASASAPSRGSRMLFALLAAGHLLQTFWSLENLRFVELIYHLAACSALAMFAADFHLAPRRSQPYRAVWLAVIVTVVAMGLDILLTVD